MKHLIIVHESHGKVLPAVPYNVVMGPFPAKMCTHEIQAEDVLPGRRAEVVTMTVVLLEHQSAILEERLQYAGDHFMDIPRRPLGKKNYIQ